MQLISSNYMSNLSHPSISRVLTLRPPRSPALEARLQPDVSQLHNQHLVHLVLAAVAHVGLACCATAPHHHPARRRGPLLAFHFTSKPPTASSSHRHHILDFLQPDSVAPGFSSSDGVHRPFACRDLLGLEGKPPMHKSVSCSS